MLTVKYLFGNELPGGGIKDQFRILRAASLNNLSKVSVGFLDGIPEDPWERPGTRLIPSNLF